MSHDPTPETTDWMRKATAELEGSHTAWTEGNAGKGRVCARRAAGMALKAWLATDPRPDGPPYGRSFMNHLGALADDAQAEAAVREAAWRLAARDRPAEGFAAPVPDRLTPMFDAELILAWCAARCGG